MLVAGVLVATLPALQPTTAQQVSIQSSPQIQTKIDSLLHPKQPPAPDWDKEVLKPIQDKQTQAKSDCDAQGGTLSGLSCVLPPPPPVYVAPPEPVLPVGSHNDWLAAAGIASSDFGYADFIINHEGHYDPCVVNGGAHDCSYAINGGQRAYGVCQALPGSKMASAGADWATNPITQLRWCAGYAAGKGGWPASYNFWLNNYWW